jgi:hypothetical protein
LQRNPIFYQKQKNLEKKNREDNIHGILKTKDYNKPYGISLARLPGGITKVNFRLIDRSRGRKYKFIISSGFIGVT